MSVIFGNIIVMFLEGIFVSFSHHADNTESDWFQNTLPQIYSLGMAVLVLQNLTSRLLSGILQGCCELTFVCMPVLFLVTFVICEMLLSHV